MGKKKNPAADVAAQAKAQYERTIASGPGQTERAASEFGQEAHNNYTQATGQANADYGRISQGYQDLRSQMKPSKFSFERVSAQRPEELNESYGYLREAMPGYRDFAKTGGYSDTDIQELRARGVSPIRSAYGNTMMQLDRSRSLGGSGGQGQYVAALSRAQRELPEQMAEAMTGVNAELANSVRQGKMFGLGGMTQTGSVMGGLSSQEAQRMLQADLANQGADLQSQGMTEDSLQNYFRNNMGALQGETGLYGTTPGMASMFGNQALNGMQLAQGAEQSRNQFGLGLIDAQLRAHSMQPQSKPWWQTALNIAGTAAPYVGMMFGPAGMAAGGAVGRGLSGVNAASGWGGSSPYQGVQFGGGG